MEENQKKAINVIVKQHKGKIGRNLIILIAFIFLFAFIKFLSKNYYPSSSTTSNISENNLFSLNFENIKDQLNKSKGMLFMIIVMFTIFILIRRSNLEWEQRNFKIKIDEETVNTILENEEDGNNNKEKIETNKQKEE